MTPAGILERLDVISALVAELRAELAAQADDVGADDLAADLIDTTSASARFGYPRDTVASWARQGDGVKRGGRWMVDPQKLRARINGR